MQTMQSLRRAAAAVPPAVFAILSAACAPRGERPRPSPAPSAVLQEAQREPLLAFASRTVELQMAFGETDSRDVRVIGRMAMAARLRVVDADASAPEVVVTAGDANTPQGLRLTSTGTRVGHAAGQLRVATGLDTPAELTLLYSWQVRGNLTVAPTNPVIDLRAPPPVGVSVRIASSRADFRIDGVEIVDGPFRASFRRGDPIANAFDVDVSPVASKTTGDRRGFAGTLRVLSNDPAEPRKDVPLFALGVLN